MQVRNPEDLHRLFAAALNADDLDALMSLYAPDAALVPQPGQAAIGKAAIREALAGFLVMKPVIALTTRGIVKTADLALLYSSWVLRGTGPDGTPVEMTGRGTEVARRQADGTWRLAPDNPYAVG